METSDIKFLNARTAILAKIDFSHWIGQNSYFSDVELNKSMRSALTLIKRRGFLKDFYPTRALDYSSKLEVEIKRFDSKKPDYSRLAIIFDLIQAWGGISGRTPYIKKRGAKLSTRERYEKWKDDYLNGARAALENRPVDALREWKKIYGLGSPFASKHLRFWTGRYPILDTRMSLLLCGDRRLLRKPDHYEDFLKLIEPLSGRFNANILETEKALFAFSQNFFQNNELNFKNEIIEDKTDIQIAKELTAT